MKIVITCPCIDKFSGIENYVIKIAKIFLNRSDTNIFIFPTFKFEKNKVIDFFKNKRIKILENKSPMEYLGKNQKKSGKLFEYYCKYYDFDLIIDNTGILPLSKKILNNKKYFLVQHFDVKHFLYKINTLSGLLKRVFRFFSFKPLKFRYAKNIICFTEFDEKIIKKYAKIKDQKFYKIPLSSFNEKLISSKKSELKINIKNKTAELIYIGRIIKVYKRIHWILPLFKIAKKNKWKIKIFGWGSYAKRLEEITKQKITSIELNNNNKKIQEYSSSMFSVIFSPYEGFPYSVVEATSLGVPVIMRYKFNNSNYFKKALKIKTWNKNKFAKEVQKLINFFINNKEEYYRLCIDSIDFALKNLTTEIFEKKWNEILDSKFNF